MTTRYAVAFGTALAPTSTKNQKKVDNTDNNIIFLKNSFLIHFQNLTVIGVESSPCYRRASTVFWNLRLKGGTKLYGRGCQNC